MMINRIDQCFSKLRSENRKAFIPFITAGDPDLGTTIQLVKAMAGAGADIIELGVPYSEPVADGPVIQQATQRALESGTTLIKILQTVKDIRESEDVPLVLMSYYNPILQYGLDNFARDASGCGVDGLIVPDLPLEETGSLLTQCKKQNIYLIPLVAPTTTHRRLVKITFAARGFIYCVSVAGITGVRQEINNEIAKLTERISTVSSLPVAVGFGVSTPGQAVVVARHCDAVIVGSAIVNNIANNIGNGSDVLVSSVADMVAEFKSAIGDLEVNSIAGL